jgi:hypothetical protein
MTWKRCYRIKSYSESSLWLIPIGAVVTEQAFAALIHALDAPLG